MNDEAQFKPLLGNRIRFLSSCFRSPI